MSRTAVKTARGGLLGQAADWVVLLKPRIAVFVMLAAFTGGLLAEGPGGDLARCTAAALLIGCTAGAAGIFNQVLERDLDARMRRTQDRPLVTGRLRARDAILLAAVLTLVGSAGLALWFNPLAALLALGTLLAYALVYTPLKRLSSFNTAVGAIPGAMPPLLGYVALAGGPGLWAWSLFAVLFVWQFPHFLAIAWMYREDYRRAGMRMLPALPDTAGLAGRQAFLYSLVLLPISLLPALRGQAGWVFTGGALALAGAYVLASALFALRETHGRARAVLLVSLAYLPLLFSLVLFDPVVHRALSS